MGKRIFAKHPVIKSIKDFKINIESDAKIFNMDRNKYLDCIIRGEMGDIISSTEMIEREKQRIKKAKKNIKMFLSVMAGKSSKKCKTVLKKVYKDILSSQLQEVKNKIKK
jgi:uncharacterized protein (UPF0335 family)